MRSRSTIPCLLALCAIAATAHAQPAAPAAQQPLDVVVVAPKPDEPGRIIMTGKVIDYTGAQLTIEIGSNKQTIPGKRIVEVRSTWHADELAGEELWRKRDYAAALARFQSAFAAEQRRWVRRKLQARIVDCLREQELWSSAADAFILLLRDDPTTPYYASFPLPWTSFFPDAALETKAKKWSAETTNSAAALFGAAVLLSSTARIDGLNRLKELTLDGDPRIALIAEAQLWRSATVTADLAAVEVWERKLDKIPEELAAGPAVIVGKAWSQRSVRSQGVADQAIAERAALVLLRVPILYPDQHRLAGEALWTAGQMLEQLGQPSRAADLYRELARDYPKSQLAGQAGERLKELDNAPKTP